MLDRHNKIYYRIGDKEAFDCCPTYVLRCMEHFSWLGDGSFSDLNNERRNVRVVSVWGLGVNFARTFARLGVSKKPASRFFSWYFWHHFP